MIRLHQGFLTAAVWLLAQLSLPSTGFCEEAKSKGIGPITELQLGPLNQQLADKGRAVFETKCSACHKMEERYVGPALKGVTAKRSPEWVINMILNPQEMIQKDPDAQELFGEYLVPMTFQNVTQDEAKAIYEYLRDQDSRNK